MDKILLSVVIPTFNEEQAGFLQKILEILENIVITSKTNINTNIEIICVDSSSTDNTVSIIKQFAEKFPVQLITTTKDSRGARLNIGMQAAVGNMLLLHHPRTIVPIAGIEYLVNNLNINNNKLIWGGFKHNFDCKHLGLKYISWYSDNIRLKRKNIVYLDHCIFLSSNLAKIITPIPEMYIFEDTEISRRLNNYCKPSLLPFDAVTSAIRFKKNGILKQYCLNQILKLCYAAGMSDVTMNKIYEKRISLNS